MKYNKLTIVKDVEPKINSRGHKVKRVLCKCDCGNFKETDLSGLKLGRPKSCGCFNKEQLIKTQTKHGYSKHELYTVWKNIKARCSNPNLKSYKSYGVKE